MASLGEGARNLIEIIGEGVPFNNTTTNQFSPFLQCHRQRWHCDGSGWESDRSVAEFGSYGTLTREVEAVA
jgi:hypothetical protein